MTFVEFRLACGCLLAFSAACMLAGCGWSPPTLAVESPPSSKSSPPTESPAAKTETTAEKIADAAPVSPGTTEDEETKPSSTSETQSMTLQPKLSKVDPEQLVGRWQDSFFGTRTLTLNADGTARMELDLNFAGRLLYGKRLDFDMKWSVEGGTVIIDVLEGKPDRQAKSAMETWGSRYIYLVDNIEDQRIEMRESDGSMNYTLRRLPDDKSSDSK